MSYIIQLNGNRAAAMVAIAYGERGFRTVEMADLLAPARMGGWRRDATPIGSVEWTRQYAACVGVHLPDPETYPAELHALMVAPPRRTLFNEVPADAFCKPVRCKAFTGAVKRAIAEHVDPAEPVYELPAADIRQEWRAYIAQGEIVGVARYDDHYGPGRVPAALIAQALDLTRGQAPAGWALDVGTLADGRDVVVEVNDGWGLGYYRGCAPRAYLRCIDARWAQLSGEGQR